MTKNNKNGTPAPDDSHVVENDRVYVLDTTLRDGEQSPGFSMDVEQKMSMAQSLRDLGVDTIEAGFAASSPGDFESVRRVASEIEGPAICSLSRAFEADVEAAGKALEPAAKKRIHVFLATSPIHRQAKLQMSKAEVLEHAVRSMQHARTFTDDVQFSPEDSARTEPEYLREVVEAVIDAGATTINLTDTVGYMTPDEMFAMVSDVKNNVPNIGKARISVHCHNDLGLAVANSLAALKAGARQVEGTINGIGERAGNASIEEVIMAIRTRQNVYNFDLNVDTTKIYPASAMLAELTGNPVQRNKAIVGRNAFAHEAGIHQHGMMQDASTYEIMKPQDIGIPESRLVLGKHSGRHAFGARLKDMGHTFQKDDFERLFAEFKVLADHKKEVMDSDLVNLVEAMNSPASRAREEVSGAIYALYQ